MRGRNALSLSDLGVSLGQPVDGEDKRCMVANMQPKESTPGNVNPQDLGSYLRHLRNQRKLGLREAARELEVDAGHLSKLERNVGMPPGGELILRLAKYYGVPVDELLRRAKARTLATVAADRDLASEIAAFYRLASGRTRAERVQMLLGALQNLNLPPEEVERWKRELEALAEDGPELLRLGRGRSAMYSARCTPRRLRATTIEAQAERILARAFGSLDAYTPPTPIDQLVEYGKHPITVEAITAEDPSGALLDDGSPAVLGMTRFGEDGRPTIAIHECIFGASDATSRRRANFTLGHEYYHAIEHLPRMRERDPSAVLNRQHVCSASRLRRRLRTPEDWREWQANTFAAAILMPAEAVNMYFQEAFDREAAVAVSNQEGDCARSLASHPAISSGRRRISLADLFDVNPQAMGYRLTALGLVSEEAAS